MPEAQPVDLTAGNHQLVPLDIDPLKVSFFLVSLVPSAGESGAQVSLELSVRAQKISFGGSARFLEKIRREQQQALATAWGTTWLEAQAWQSQASSRSKQTKVTPFKILGNGICVLMAWSQAQAQVVLACGRGSRSLWVARCNMGYH